MDGAVKLEPLSPEERAAYEWPTAADHARREAASGRYPQPRADLEADWQAGIHRRRLRDSPDDQLLFAITRDGDRVGTVWLTTSGHGTHLTVQDVFVDPPHRRQGVGRATIPLLDAVARQHGADDLLAFVFASDTLSMRLFRELGYQTQHLYLETDPRVAKRRLRLPVGRLRPMSVDAREALLRRGDGAAGSGPKAPDVALAGSPGRVLLRLHPGPEGTTAQVAHLERSDRSDLGTIRLISALVWACRDRGDARVLLQVRPDRRAVLDRVDVADWRVGSVALRRSVSASSQAR